MSRPSDQHDELIFLLGALRDEEITADQFARLEQLLSQDADARQFFIRFMTLHASLEQVGSVDVMAEQVRETLEDEEVVRQLRKLIVRDTLPRSKSKWRWSSVGRYLVAGLAAAAFLAFVYLSKFFTVLQEDTTRSAEIAALYGRVELSDTGIQVALGTVVRSGQSVTTGPQAYARLRYPDGSMIDLNAGTELALGASRRSKQLTLVEGDMFATVSPQPRHMPLLVNPGRYDQVQVVGTSFELKRRASGESRVRVTSGAVVFGMDDKSLRVEAGHESVASRKEEPTTPKELDLVTVWHGLSRGLAATYYDDEELNGKSITRVDPAIDFNWKKGSPDPAISPETFSARWTGRIQAEHSEPYTFWIAADHGVRLWVDDQLVIDRWKDQSHLKSGSKHPVRLTEGRKHDFKLEYHHHKGAANVKLWWRSPSTPKAVVSQSHFYPSAEPNSD